MEWNSSLYDNKHDFVAEYGKGLLEFIPKNNVQTILDLGCGTGTLTAQLADLCSKVVGVDSSQNMIDKAKNSLKTLSFPYVMHLHYLLKKNLTLFSQTLFFIG